MILPAGRYSSHFSRFYPIILILGVALVLRLVWISKFNPTPKGEFLDVHIEALYSSKGGSNYRNYRPPGYPFFISLFYRLFGSNYRLVHYLNVCLGMLSCLLIYLVGAKIFSRNIGLVAGFLAAVHPGFIGLCSLLANENLFIALLSLGIFLLLQESARGKLFEFGAAGILWAGMASVQPTVLLFPFYLLVVYFRKYRKYTIYKKIIVVCLVTVLYVVGWMVKNYRTFKYTKIIRRAGIALWLGNNPTHYLGIGRTPRNLSTNIFMDWRDRRYLRRAVREIIKHPLQFLGKSIIKLENFYTYRDHSLSFTVEENYRGLLGQKKYLNQVFYMDPFFRCFAYFLLGGALVFAAASFTWKLPLGILFHFIIYWSLIHMIFLAKPRLRLSLDPVLITIAAAVIIRLWERIASKYKTASAI